MKSLVFFFALITFSQTLKSDLIPQAMKAKSADELIKVIGIERMSQNLKRACLSERASGYFPSTCFSYLKHLKLNQQISNQAYKERLRGLNEECLSAKYEVLATIADTSSLSEVCQESVEKKRALALYKQGMDPHEHK